MKKLIRFFTVNLFWKILSVIFAITLWIVAVAINNPIQNKSMLIPLSLINLNELTDNGYILLNQDELESTNVEIIYSATRTMVDSMEDAKDDIRATLDLKPLDIAYGYEMGENIPLTVQVSLPSYLTYANQNFVELESYISISPRHVSVVLDQFITREVPVSVNIIGEPVDGYVDTTAVVTPNTIRISGAKSKVSLIKNVETSIDITDATQDVNRSSGIVILDGNREPVSNIEISTSDVEITVPIKKYKSIPVNVGVTGQVADNFDIISVEIEPTHIEIFGTEEEVDEFKTLALDAINVDDFSETSSINIDVRPYLLETSLNVRNDTPHEVVVTVNIGAVITKEITVSTQNISATGLKGSVELPADISFTITGLQYIIDELDETAIKGNMNLSELAEGTHLAPVEFILPKGVTIISVEPMLEVTIIDTNSLEEDTNYIEE